MIPKVIHYCWLSNDKMPIYIRECIRSWKRTNPEYKLRLWSMKDLEEMNPPEYVYEAIKAKKWAFACDYIRLHAIYSEGGIYMDTDVYVKGSLNGFLNHRFFSAIETFPGSDHSIFSTAEMPHGIQIQAAILGSEKGHPFVKDCLNWYKSHHFTDEQGNNNIKMISPFVYAQEAIKYGFEPKNCEQTLTEGMHIYPIEIFAPNQQMVTPESVAIHCCANSWMKKEKKQTSMMKLRNIIKEICYYLHIPSNRFLQVK